MVVDVDQVDLVSRGRRHICRPSCDCRMLNAKAIQCVADAAADASMPGCRQRWGDVCGCATKHKCDNVMMRLCDYATARQRDYVWLYIVDDRGDTGHGAVPA